MIILALLSFPFAASFSVSVLQSNHLTYFSQDWKQLITHTLVAGLSLEGCDSGGLHGKGTGLQRGQESDHKLSSSDRSLTVRG